MKLTDKQRLFIEHYLTCLNATEAARRAGYSAKTAYSIGHENLSKPEIADEISRRVAEVAMSADEVLRRLADHARGTLEDFIKVGKGGSGIDKVGRGGDSVDLNEAQKAGKLHLLKKIRVDKDGSITVELHDPQTALIQLGRYHGLFLDKTAFTDPTGKHPIPVIYLPAVDGAKGEDGNA